MLIDKKTLEKKTGVLAPRPKVAIKKVGEGKDIVLVLFRAMGLTYFII